jgi:[ribosomal protein S18]-alanine N-acetyltransferase
LCIFEPTCIAAKSNICQGVKTISVSISSADTAEKLPHGVSVSRLAELARRWMIPYADTVEDTRRGIEDALSGRPAPGGFVLCASEGSSIVGICVMLSTGMTGYIPPNLLLFLAVDPDFRRAGIGSRLVENALQKVNGPVKLHVEADNPARYLYERQGFIASYLDMRLKKGEKQ